MNIKLIETYLKKEVETLAEKGKEFIKNLSKYDSNKERLGGKRVLRPVDMTDGMMFIYDSTANGSSQSDEIKSHTHSINDAADQDTYNSPRIAATGGTETRPKNIAEPYYIKV